MRETRNRTEMRFCLESIELNASLFLENESRIEWGRVGLGFGLGREMSFFPGEDEMLRGLGLGLGWACERCRSFQSRVLFSTERDQCTLFPKIESKCDS